MPYEPHHQTTPDLSALFASEKDTVRDLLACLDRSKRGIVLFADSERHLMGTVTEGDIRRAILANIDLDTSAQALLQRKAGTRFEKPVVAPVGSDAAVLLRLLKESKLQHVPLVDTGGRVVDLVRLDDLFPQEFLPLNAVVMAGGPGQRLRPLTETLPKPMLPVGDKPLLEIIIAQLRQAGVRRVNLTTHYKGDRITEHFGDGGDYGVDIHYVTEEQPLGTAGALSRMPASDDPLLVINGDILTNVDFRAMLDFHRENQADMTVAVRPYEFRVPYGVVETDGIAVTGISEKPLIRSFINAGIYLLDPAACRYVPDGQSYGMPDLINRLLAEGRRVISFPVHEYWMDIGSADNYRQAQEDMRSGKVQS